MHFGTLCRLFLIAGFPIIAVPGRCDAQPGGTLPDAATVMENVIRRSDEVARADEADEYRYEKRSVEEELDAAGKATKTTEEIYEVIPIQGMPFERLVKVQGRELTVKEIKEQDRKEAEFRKSVAEHAPQKSSMTNNGWLDKKLVDYFIFRVEGRSNFLGRSMLMVSFEPKARGPEKTIADKVLKRLAGTLWIDEQDSEIVLVKVRLTADLSLGLFGMIGSLKQFDLTIERERLPDGVWVDRKQTLVLGGRKVFSTMHFRAVEESSNFRKP
jgi:hypothetical protein